MSSEKMENIIKEAKEFFTIDFFDKKDQKEIKQFGLRVSKEIGQTYDSNLDSDWDKIYETYISPGGAFYVVKIDEHIVGCAGIKKIDQVAEFKRDRVAKEYRGKGIGRTLFEKRLEFAKNNGFKKVILDTVNPIIQHLCEEFGFKKVTQKGNVVFYEKTL